MEQSSGNSGLQYIALGLLLAGQAIIEEGREAATKGEDVCHAPPVHLLWSDPSKI